MQDINYTELALRDNKKVTICYIIIFHYFTNTVLVDFSNIQYRIKIRNVQDDTTAFKLKLTVAF